MLRTLVKQHLPEPALGATKKVYREFRLVDAEPEIVPFDELFAGVEKQFYQAPEIVSTPEVRRMPIWEKATKRRGSTYTIPEGFAAVLHDVLYCPYNNVIMTDDRRVVAESIRYGKEGAGGLWRQALRLREVEPISGYCALLRSAGAYYHWLIDNLPHVLPLNESPFAEMKQIKLLGEKPPAVAQFLLDKMAPENARVVAPEKNRLYRIENLIFIPSRTRTCAGYLPQAYVAEFRDRVLPDRPSTREHRVFISRENSGKRRIANRGELMTALKQRGFTKVLPEELTPREEVELFYDAEAVVGGHGSGLTNVLFAQDASVIELFQTSFMIPHFYYLSKSLGHAYAYWCGEGNDWVAESSEVDVSAVLKLLDEMEVC